MASERFWSLTYAEFVAEYDGWVGRTKEKYKEMLWSAWHVAALSRQRKLPDLKTLLRDDDKRTEPQSAEQMMAMARILNAAFGGEEVEG